MVDIANCPSHLFTRSDQVIDAELPDNARFVMFEAGEAPMVIPYEAAGTYTLAIDRMPMGCPVLICTVPAEYADQFADMTVEKAFEILQRAARKAGITTTH